MASVAMKTTLAASADAVWEVVSDFNGLPKYVAAIAASTMEGTGLGAVRTLTLAGGGTVVERLESQDDAARTLSYSIVRSPLPLESYLATVAVRPQGDDVCEIQWSSTFEPAGAAEEEASEIVRGVYSGAFEGLRKLFGG